MTQIDSLPPDQRAAVQLLLKQGQTYDQLGDLLAIDGSAVRQRAHSALDALGGDLSAGLEDGDRADVADYLLGQQTVAGREDTRDLLADLPEARAWARTVSEELRPLADDALPEVPPARRPARTAPAGAAATASAPASGRERAGGRERAPYEDSSDEEPAGSRLGGALLLGGVGVIAIVVAVLLLTGGDDSKPVATNTTPTNTQTNTQTNTRTAPDGTRPIGEIPLTPPGGGTPAGGANRPAGLARVFQRGQERAVIIAGQGVPPGAYALWLINSPTQARFLGFVPQRVSANGRFATQGVLPPQANQFRILAVTRENPRSTRQPSRPGHDRPAGPAQPAGLALPPQIPPAPACPGS